MIISVRILGIVANVDCSVRIVIGIPMCLFQVSLRNVAFAPSFQDNIGFI